MLDIVKQLGPVVLIFGDGICNFCPYLWLFMEREEGKNNIRSDFIPFSKLCISLGTTHKKYNGYKVTKLLYLISARAPPLSSVCSQKSVNTGYEGWGKVWEEAQNGRYKSLIGGAGPDCAVHVFIVFEYASKILLFHK
mgnify:CR=1 FL=1